MTDCSPPGPDAPADRASRRLRRLPGLLALCAALAMMAAAIAAPAGAGARARTRSAPATRTGTSLLVSQSGRTVALPGLFDATLAGVDLMADPRPLPQPSGPDSLMVADDVPTSQLPAIQALQSGGPLQSAVLLYRRAGRRPVIARYALTGAGVTGIETSKGTRPGRVSVAVTISYQAATLTSLTRSHRSRR